MKQSIAWECAFCKKRHRWSWSDHDPVIGKTVLACDDGGCYRGTPGYLVPIGRDAWALAQITRNDVIGMLPKEKP